MIKVSLALFFSKHRLDYKLINWFHHQNLKFNLKKKLLAQKKKKTFKTTWDESSASEDEEQTNEDEVANYVFMAFDDEIYELTKTSLSYNELFDAFHDLYDELKIIGKKYKLLKKDHVSPSL